MVAANDGNALLAAVPWATEACLEALRGVFPQRVVNPAVRSLSRVRADRLVEAIREALGAGITHGGTTLRDYVSAEGEQGRNQHHLHCYGRAGEPCERCGTELRSRTLDARTTTWCPVRCGNLTILSSIDGQYRTPVPSIIPP